VTVFARKYLAILAAFVRFAVCRLVPLLAAWPVWAARMRQATATQTARPAAWRTMDGRTVHAFPPPGRCCHDEARERLNLQREDLLNQSQRMDQHFDLLRVLEARISDQDGRTTDQCSNIYRHARQIERLEARLAALEPVSRRLDARRCILDILDAQP